MPLSDTQIRNLKPQIIPYKVSDFEGLYITVTATGSKLWHMKYRISGREKRLSFGSYPKITLANADFGQTPIADITSSIALASLRKVESKGNYETAKRTRSPISIFKTAALRLFIGRKLLA